MFLFMHISYYFNIYSKLYENESLGIRKEQRPKKEWRERRREKGRNEGQERGKWNLPKTKNSPITAEIKTLLIKHYKPSTISKHVKARRQKET